MDARLGLGPDGINTELSGLAASWLDRAEAAGLANEELAAVIKILASHAVC
jgi:hypothetical protein